MHCFNNNKQNSNINFCVDPPPYVQIGIIQLNNKRKSYDTYCIVLWYEYENVQRTT
jgi:hypothetical protein